MSRKEEGIYWTMVGELMYQKILNLFETIEKFPVISSIRNGLVMTIPIVLIGSFILICKNIPVQEYQSFLSSFGNGVVLNIMNYIYDATFGMLALYIMLAISSVYARDNIELYGSKYGIPLTAVACFFIFTGASGNNFNLTSFGALGVFTGIVSAIIPVLFYQYGKNISQKCYYKFSSVGVDSNINKAISEIFPILFIIFPCASINAFVVQGLGYSSFQDFFLQIANLLFSQEGRSFLGGICWVFSTTFLWFLGVHGSNVLEGVAQHLFPSTVVLNVPVTSMGGIPHEILTKEFFNIYILMGGCGTSTCLLLAVFFFSKRKSSRGIAKIAAVPILFNVSEILVFGLPTVFNPILFIPFIGVPIIGYCIAYFSVSIGLVPVITHDIHWTMPIFFSGYFATESYMGAVLQGIILLVGTFIYRPFIRVYDAEKIRISKNYLQDLIDTLQKNEQINKNIILTQLQDQRGRLAKALLVELNEALKEKKLKLFYQPQYNHSQQCVGAEALLRWEHEFLGMIYPPLMIKLAEEAGFLKDLEKFVVVRAVHDMEFINFNRKEPLKICINVSAITIQDTTFEKFLDEVSKKKSVQKGSICLEITEQTALCCDEDTEAMFARIRKRGFQLAIDDFSMGHTSLKYLQVNQFDMVKLDGTLVKKIMENPRAKEIVSSIIALSHTLGFTVLAEYVETENQRVELEKLGCLNYQGYLYSPAIEFEEFIRYIEKRPEEAGSIK